MAIESYKRVPRLSGEDLVRIQFFWPDPTPVSCGQTMMVRHLNGCVLSPAEADRCSTDGRFGNEADWAAVVAGLKVCSGENCNLRLGAPPPKLGIVEQDQDEELFGCIFAEADHNIEVESDEVRDVAR